MRNRLRPITVLLCSMGLVGLLGLSLPAQAGGEIYGTIRTASGKTLTGPIRWDINENFWDDALNATKHEQVKREEEGYQFRVFGLKLGRGNTYTRHAFSVPFGHIRTIERDGDRVVVTMKNSSEFIVHPGSTDLGSSMRGLTIVDAEAGEQQIRWSEFDRVEFRQAPGEGRDARRLWGTVETDAETIAGYIVWDRDESMFEDVLDGDDGDRDRKIPLGDVRVIEPKGSRGSLLTLKDDTRVTLTGTNDVGRGHRGVQVNVPGMGNANVPWSEVVRVTFETAPASPRYEAFDGGRRLSGVVHTHEGQQLRGEIVWDLDEKWSWETLDGDRHEVDWAVTFDNIASITLMRNHSEVRLRNNRLLVLRNSNDVNQDNKGIVVTRKDGEKFELDWGDVVKVTFD